LFRDNEHYNYIIIEEFLITNQRISDAFKIEIEKNRGVDLTIISTNQFNKIDIGIVSRSLELELVACDRACPRFCVNGLMAGNCQSSPRKRNDRKQRTDRPPAGGLQKT
jgi:hypothetical protein